MHAVIMGGECSVQALTRLMRTFFYLLMLPNVKV